MEAGTEPSTEIGRGDTGRKEPKTCRKDRDRGKVKQPGGGGSRREQGSSLGAWSEAQGEDRDLQEGERTREWSSEIQKRVGRQTQRKGK